MDCPVCGYVMEPFETACPRCARRATQPCGNCGRLGIAGECLQCHRQVCAVCFVPIGQGGYCSVCAPADAAAAHDAQLAQQGGAAALPGPGFVRDVPPPGAAGWVADLTRGWAFMKESLSLALRHPRLIVPPLLSVFISAGLLVALAAVLYQNGQWDQLERAGDYTPFALLAAFVLLAFVCYAIAFFFDGMTVHLINVHLRGREARLGPAFWDALRNSAALLLLAGATALVSLLTSSRNRRRGLLDLQGLASEAVYRVWMVAIFLFLPIIILEDVGLFRAVARAQEIHARNLIPIAVAEIGVQVVNRIIGFVAMLVAVVVVMGLVSLNPGLLLPAIIGAGLGMTLVIAYTGFVRTAYYTCLYLWAVERAAAADLAAVPLPLARALAAA